MLAKRARLQDLTHRPPQDSHSASLKSREAYTSVRRPCRATSATAREQDAHVNAATRHHRKLVQVPLRFP